MKKSKNGKRVFQLSDTVTVVMQPRKGAPEEVSEEILEVRQYVVEPARVDLNLGLTINLGNFESARVDVGVSLPCYSEEVDATYERAKEWAGARLQHEAQAVRGRKHGKVPF